MIFYTHRENTEYIYFMQIQDSFEKLTVYVHVCIYFIMQTIIKAFTKLYQNTKMFSINLLNMQNFLLRFLRMNAVLCILGK